jgi:Regulator of Chromosome Condensation (RCC1) repeat protein/Big-like domain-containing protein
MSHRSWIPLSVAAVVVVGSCLTEPSPSVGAVRIALDSLLLERDTSVLLTALVEDADGNTINRVVSWSSTAPTVVGVSPGGLVFALGVGNAYVVASVGAVRDSAMVVVHAPIEAITLAPDGDSLEVTDTIRLIAALRDSGGVPVPRTTGMWQSLDPAIATTDTTGLVTAVASGIARIVARWRLLADTATVRVLVPAAAIRVRPDTVTATPGASLPLTATFLDMAGDTITRRTRWTSLDPAVAIVDSAGVLTAVAVGATQVIVDGARLRDTVTIRVRLVRLQSVLASAPNSAGTTCGIATDSTAWCWGRHGTHHLGADLPLGITGGVTVSVPIGVYGGRLFTLVSTGDNFACALDPGGGAWCWGWGINGRLGNGDLQDRPFPAPVSGGLSYSTLTSGRRHTCGLLADGAAWCWGAAGSGQIGEPTTSYLTVPRLLTDSLAFLSLTSGQFHTCGLGSDSLAYCWGLNSAGELGDSTTISRGTIAPVRTTERFATLSGEWSHTCGLTSQGAAHCWGSNASGALGTGDSAQHLVPMPVAGGHTFSAISAGAYHTCALTPTGEAFCWGYNAYGALGTGDRVNYVTPTGVLGGHQFSSISAGEFLTCGITTAGVAYCWGWNSTGQIGDGTVGTDRLQPTRVAGQP